MADVENARKRAQREKEDAAKFGASLLAKDVVLFVDNLERALLHSPNAAAPEEVKSFIDGIAMTAKDVIATLERHGICKINSNGQPFDPELHQAVAEVPTENEPGGMVFDTLQTGYTINGRLLRAAMVAVTKNT
jgi:molecular chaperone GrpE